MHFLYTQVRSLGYVVVGVNEFYTSKKCPMCHQFVCQVNIRRLYCEYCKKFMHRDVMAGHNLANVVQGHLREQRRPRYLQPVDQNGVFPWERPVSVVHGSSTSTSNNVRSGDPESMASSSGRCVGTVSQTRVLQWNYVSGDVF